MAVLILSAAIMALAVAVALVGGAAVASIDGLVPLLRRLAPGCTCPMHGLAASSTCPAHRERGPVRRPDETSETYFVPPERGE